MKLLSEMFKVRSMAMLIPVFYLSTLFVGFASCAIMVCPPKEDLEPCYCRQLAYGLFVGCANFNSSSSLLKAFKIMREYYMTTVLFHHLYITDVLPNDLFHGTYISGVTVNNSTLKFSQPAFTGLDDTLQYLSVLKHSVIKSKDDFILARLSKLEEFRMAFNHLPKVQDTWLNGKVPNVRTLVLDNNGITELEIAAFSTLSQLKSISIANNQIRSVSRSMFSNPAQHLENIDLTNNEIETLPFDFFFYMPSLKHVFLAENNLKTLPKMTWLPVWENLSDVILTGNKIVCDRKLEWLKKIRRVNNFKGDCVAPKEVAGKPIWEVYYGWDSNIM
ncbi:leucine-rich repeat and fibronectin type III domain-containing protein 1-like protein isoform X2 [Stegodyphus dumicola]|uniref:leucine-rich repeat and fibronectin type III domain-containing protein 1-like protein isoform X2 n=1 Tax=Stegodyphus dumicola TaxID=202533 RepID=UPI0015AF2D43|nr:leucine-rich repeat and fibronectin type III domain-containing protein 1-like protein isoform X2 [Stegodyphus dumicola]